MYYMCHVLLSDVGVIINTRIFCIFFQKADSLQFVKVQMTVMLHMHLLINIQKMLIFLIKL